MPAQSLPERVMPDVPWSLAGKTFDTLASFNDAVRQYGLRVLKTDKWKPDQRVIPAPRIAVVYEYWEGDDQLGATVELASDDDAGFTAAELLFKLHNAVAARLTGQDHQFFEGLNLDKNSSTDNLPLYYLRTGS